MGIGDWGLIQEAREEILLGRRTTVNDDRRYFRLPDKRRAFCDRERSFIG